VAEEKREGYLAWSRDPAVGLLTVAPLWIAYEVLRLSLQPGERNGAEALMSEALRWLGPAAGILPRALFFVAVLIAARSVMRRQLPWGRLVLVAGLEGSLWGLVLGPLAAALAEKSYRLLGAGASPAGLVHDIVASLGAGIFEELFFRLMMLPLLVLLLARACDVFAIPRSFATAGGILLSAFVFAVFHHIGPGAPRPELAVLLFRTAAGTLLGALFVARGFGVCVWAHTVYDVHYFMSHHA
jgi:membrane protease YdiL (CAAX protease family)